MYCSDGQELLLVLVFMQASRKTDDADLLALAKEKGWKQCKQCR